MPALLLSTYSSINPSRCSYGAELTATYQLSKTWRLFGSYSLFEIQARGGDPLAVGQFNGSSPSNQSYLRSSWDLNRDLKLDLIGRYVDQTGLQIPKYIEMDCRVAWQARKNHEVSVVGQNLLNNHHLEFVDFRGRLASTEVRRGGYLMLSWTY